MIKFCESNKFDSVYSKIWNIFVWSNFLKMWRVLIIKLAGWKTSNQILNHHIRKTEENTTTINEHETSL